MSGPRCGARQYFTPTADKQLDRMDSGSVRQTTFTDPKEATAAPPWVISPLIFMKSPHGSPRTESQVRYTYGKTMLEKPYCGGHVPARALSCTSRSQVDRIREKRRTPCLTSLWCQEVLLHLRLKQRFVRPISCEAAMES